MKYSVNFTCPFCGKTHYVIVDAADWINYTEGVLAQNAFPDLSATEREQIISHLCPECQDKIFNTDDDDVEFDLFSFDEYTFDY